MAIWWSGSIFKLFCPNTINITYDKLSNPNTPAWVILYMDFNPADIVFDANNFSFSNLFPAWWISPSLTTWFHGANSRLSAQRWGINNILPNQWNVGTISFYSKKVNQTNLSLYTSGRWFNDRLSDTDLYYNNWEDMLTSVSGATYYFVTWLCNPDIAWPIVTNFFPNITLNNRQVWYGPHTRWPIQNVSPKIFNNNWLSFRVNDGDSYTKNQPWYITWTYDNLNYNDYFANTAGSGVYRPLNVADRASGINPASLRFQFSHMPGITFNQNNVFSIDGLWYTWDRRHRDYAIQIASNQIDDFGIENPIYFSGYRQEFSTKDRHFVYNFNPAIAPWLTNLDPYNWQTEILPYSDIRLRVRDDRAWVDSWYLVVTVLDGTEIVKVFSGDDLHLEAISWDADYNDYNIHIYSGTNRSFPIDTGLNIANTITIKVDARDLKNNTTIAPYDRYQFDTRYSCRSYPWCMDPLIVYIYDNTGNMNSYPYLPWDMLVYSNDAVNVDTWTQTLNCGSSSWSLNIWTYIHGDGLINPNADYRNDKLYIIGADVTISWNTLILQAE